MKSLVILAIMLWMAGCESTPPPQANSKKIPDVRDDVGLVVVLRFGLGLRMSTGSMPIYVDNQEVFAVEDWRYTYFWVKPGPHTFRAEWSALDKVRYAGSKIGTSTLDLDVEAGRLYFINYKIVQDAIAPPTPLESLNPLAKSTVVSAGLVLETHESGRSNLSFCRFQENHWR